MKKIIILAFFIVTFLTSKSQGLILTTINTIDSSWSLYEANTPSSSYGNRINWVQINRKEFKTRLGKIRLDSLAIREQGEPNKFVWIASDGELKVTSKSNITFPISAIVGLQDSLTSRDELTGVIKMYAGTTAPDGYLLCNGTAISRTTYSDLFTIIGTTYGAGDGSTTFNLPDLRQRFPLGVASSGTGSSLGSNGGNIDHVHSVDPPNTTSSQSVNINNVTLLALGQASAPSHTHDVNIAQFNSGTANPPFIALNFIIKD